MMIGGLPRFEEFMKEWGRNVFMGIAEFFEELSFAFKRTVNSISFIFFGQVWLEGDE